MSKNNSEFQSFSKIKFKIFMSLSSLIIVVMVIAGSSSLIRNFSFLIKGYFVPAIQNLAKNPEKLISTDYLAEHYRESEVIKESSGLDALNIMRKHNFPKYRIGPFYEISTDAWLMQIAVNPIQISFNPDTNFVVSSVRYLNLCRNMKIDDFEKYQKDSACELLRSQDYRIDECPVIDMIGDAFLADCKGII